MTTTYLILPSSQNKDGREGDLSDEQYEILGCLYKTTTQIWSLKIASQLKYTTNYKKHIHTKRGSKHQHSAKMSQKSQSNQNLHLNELCHFDICRLMEATCTTSTPRLRSFTHAFIHPPDLPHFTHIVSLAHHSTKNDRSLENLVGYWQEKSTVST